MIIIPLGTQTSTHTEIENLVHAIQKQKPERKATFGTTNVLYPSRFLINPDRSFTREI